MREIFAPEIKFCRRPAAFSRFIRDRREIEKAGYTFFSYKNLEAYSDEDILKLNSRGNGIRKKETSPYKFEPLYTIEDALFAKGIDKLVFLDGFVYDLTHPEMDATEKDIEERRLEEQRRAVVRIQSGIVTREMYRYAKKRVPAETVLFLR